MSVESKYQTIQNKAHMPTPLPESLKERLLATGVEDQASLHAALESDPDLRAEYERWVIGVAMQQFAATTDAEDLRSLVQRLPILLEKPMFQAIERAIAVAQERGDAANATALAQRLAALREIKSERESRPPEMIQAVLSFVQAPDEDAATAVFFAQRYLLATDDAEGFLISHLEPDDKKARVHLEDRRQLLRKLRMEEIT